jgi:hypothetical protein
MSGCRSAVRSASLSSRPASSAAPTAAATGAPASSTMTLTVRLGSRFIANTSRFGVRPSRSTRPKRSGERPATEAGMSVATSNVDMPAAMNSLRFLNLS